MDICFIVPIVIGEKVSDRLETLAMVELMKYKVTIDGIERYLSSFDVDWLVSREYVRIPL